MARRVLVQVFPGVASAVRLLMESAKCSNFLCQASISPWGYSSHLLPQYPGAGEHELLQNAPAAAESTLASFFFFLKGIEF